MTMIPGRLYQSNISLQAWKLSPGAPNREDRYWNIRSMFETGHIALLLSVSPQSYGQVGSVYEFLDQNGVVYRVYDNYVERELFKELQ